MHTFRHSSAEHRMLHLTLEELNKQRAAAGAVAAIPLNKRAAQANAAVQNQPTRNTGSAVTDPAAASMQRLRETQAYLAQNPSVDPTGSINAQALEGQKLAQNYVAPRNLGNEEYYKEQGNFLQNYTATKSNAADGFASSIDQGVTEVKDPITGEIKYVRTQGNVQTASMSQIQQSAIDNLRKAGKTDEEIKATLNDPTYLQNIKTTMSNTGLGGTARTSAVLTPAQAQAVLATSRNPKERADAQAALDAAATQGVNQTIEKQVGTDKNGNPIYMTQTNPNYEAEVEAKRQRMAQEQANKLKVQESENKLKSFTAGVDTTALTETQKQISDIMGSIKNLSPELQTAVLPSLLNLQASNNEALSMAQQMINALPTDQEIESSYGTVEDYIISQNSKYEKMLEKNKETQLEIANYNKEALEIDKRIMEHDAAVSEQKQAQANIENEKKLRRQLNKLGIQSDVQGLNFLNSEIQKGIDNLENLKTSNNLASLKVNLALGKGYALEVKGILNDYEGKYLEISSQTTEKLNSVRQSISKDKSERDKEMRSILEKASNRKAENDKEARKAIFDANIKMIDEVGKARDDERAQEVLGWDRMEWAAKTYGSNAPQAIIDSIKEKLPNVDVAGTLTSMTLAEMKQKKVGSGGNGGSIGGGVGFKPSEMKPDGRPISFEDYVNQKESLFNAANKVDTGNISPEYLALFGEGTKAQKFDRSAAAMAKYKKEYKLKEANSKRLDPTVILDTLIDRNGNVSEKNVRESREATVKAYIANGEYEKAANFVDGLGKIPSDTTSKSFSKAATAKRNVVRLANLIEDIGTTGPVVGRFRSANPYDDRVVEFNNLVRQTVPGLARGIFGEVGVLTDADIKNYTATIANPNLTLDQARTATKNLLTTINLSIEDQLQIERAAGRATRDLTAYFSTIPDYEFGNGPVENDPDEEYASSILNQ